MLIYGVNKSEEIEEARKKEAGGVRDLQQGVMQLTQSRKRGTGLNHTHQPHIIILLFFSLACPALIFSPFLQTKQSELSFLFNRTFYLSLCTGQKKEACNPAMSPMD